jgi:tetratricopeptide (TPR) repeat protein
VGRERELELLLDGFERVKEGRGQAFSIMGEAGIGKSRLLYEFRKAIGSEDVTFLEGKCLSYIRGVAYHPIIDILKSTFNIREGDEDYQVGDKVKQGLRQLRVDEASTLPYLLELLGVKDSGIEKISMSPDGKKDRMMEAVNRISLKGSEIRPLIMAIEDLHWTDRGSEETLKYMLESIPGARVLLIFTYRPEFVHTWGSRSYHSQVTLNRLSNRESLAMVTHLLGTEQVETQLHELVLQKTEGIPFFIEEFIKSLKDLKIIEKKDGVYRLTRDIQDVTIPGTIQDMIMARVDSLPDAARRVLQTGSAIEREFSHELIKRVTGLAEQQLLSSLSLLKDAELLYERGIYPKSTYIFRHALTREVVYDSILAARKKKLHLDIADAIEEIYKNNLDENYGVLAEHYIAGENYHKGAEYCRQAERKSMATGSINDAIAYGAKRVACLERLPYTGEEEKRIIDARVSLGLYYIQRNRHIEAKEAVEPVIELALQRDYKRRISQIYTILGTYSYLVEEDFPKAFKYLEDAFTIAEELNDPLSLAMAAYWLGWALTLDCKYEKASYYLAKALDLNIAANTLWGIAMIKSVMSAFLCALQGKVDLGHRTSDEALRIAEESGDPYSKATAHTSYGFSCYYKGLLDEAEQHLSKACELCERLNWFSWHAMANLYLGLIYLEKRQYRKAKDCYSKVLFLYESNSFLPSAANFCKILSTTSNVINNEKDINLNQIFSYYQDNRLKIYQGLMSKCIGEILLNVDNQHIREAEDWVRKAIEADEKNGMMFNLGSDYALYAELFNRKGDLPEAKEKLIKAIEIYKECGADGWVEKYKKELTIIS